MVVVMVRRVCMCEVRRQLRSAHVNFMVVVKLVVTVRHVAVRRRARSRARVVVVVLVVLGLRVHTRHPHLHPRLRIHRRRRAEHVRHCHRRP